MSTKKLSEDPAGDVRGPSGARTGDPAREESRPRPPTRARVFVGVGSNIDPEENVIEALGLLFSMDGIEVTGISTFYRTPSLPPPDRSRAPRGSDADYLNGVLELRTSLDPDGLGSVLSGIEAKLGRVRGGPKYAPRTMDLDILLFLPAEAPGPAAPPSPRSMTPTHLDILSRAFVALPLLELAPNLLLPPDGVPLVEVAASFSGPGGEAERALTERLRARFLTR